MNSRFPCAGQRALHAPTRRQFLYSLGASIGSVAFTSLLSRSLQAAAPLAPKAGTLSARAKSCIFLMMEGGPSHIDTFDPKPKLAELHLQEFVREGKMKSAMESGKRYYVRSPFAFEKHGQSGADIAQNWTHLAKVADDICFYRGCQVDSVNHPTAMYQMNTGNRFGGDPGIGAWVTYGLGSMNQDLPGFIVLPEVSYPQGGAANWGNGFLPASFQGTPLRAKGSPILDLTPPAGITTEHQRANLDLLAQLNHEHAAQHPEHGELAARMDNYELAFRMQMQVPGLIDLEKEDPKLKAMDGIGSDATDAFGRSACLRAGSSRRECASSSSTPAPGIRTTTSSARTATSCATSIGPSPRCSPISSSADCSTKLWWSGAANSAVHRTTACAAARSTGAITIHTR